MMTFGSEDLKGKVYVANFIFTRCPSLCPRLTQNRAKLEAQLRLANADIRLVSFIWFSNSKDFYYGHVFFQHL